MIIPLSQINKDNPYYETLKKVQDDNAPTETDWKILKVQLGGIYLIMQTIITYLKLKKKLKSIFHPLVKKNKKHS